MSDLETPKDKTRPARRPVASASLGAVLDAPELKPEIAHRIISDIAVALLVHVADQMHGLSVDVPACAEPLAPTLRMIAEVSEELDCYRAILEQD